MDIPTYCKARGTNLHALALRSGVSYGTLRAHVLEGRPLKLDTAKRIRKGTNGEVTLAELLDLGDEEEAAPEKKKVVRKTKAA